MEVPFNFSDFFRFYTINKIRYGNEQTRKISTTVSKGYHNKSLSHLRNCLFITTECYVNMEDSQLKASEFMCGPWKHQATRGSKYCTQCQLHAAFHYETIAMPKLPTFISRTFMLKPRQHQHTAVINNHYNQNMSQYGNVANPRRASTQRCSAVNVVPKALAVYMNRDVSWPFITFKSFFFW